LSTQEQTAPKRRSSRGYSTNRRSSKRTAASQAAESTISATTVTAAASPVVTKAPVETSAEAPVLSRKERKEAATPKKGIVDTERFSPLKRYVRDTYAEIKKVNWPDQETTRNLTAVVIAVSAVAGILLGGIDFVLLKIFEAMP